MPYCSKCGQQVKEDDTFCQSCGAALASGPEVPQKAEKAVVKRSMIGRNLVLLGVILAAGSILARVLVQQTTNAYTNLDLVCDIGLAVGIVCIITGIFFSVFKKKQDFSSGKRRSGNRHFTKIKVGCYFTGLHCWSLGRPSILPAED